MPAAAEVTGVSIALRVRPVGDCLAFDAGSDGLVEINELIAAVRNGLLDI